MGCNSKSRFWISMISFWACNGNDTGNPPGAELPMRWSFRIVLNRSWRCKYSLTSGSLRKARRILSTDSLLYVLIESGWNKIRLSPSFLGVMSTSCPLSDCHTAWNSASRKTFFISQIVHPSCRLPPSRWIFSSTLKKQSVSRAYSSGLTATYLGFCVRSIWLHSWRTRSVIFLGVVMIVSFIFWSSNMV